MSQTVLDIATARDDRRGGADNQNSMTCKAPITLRSSTPKYQHLVFFTGHPTNDVKEK